MKLHQSPERAPRLKASTALQQEPAEDFSFKFKIDIDKILEEDKAGFYEDMLRPGNRPLYYLQLLDFLSVLDPAEYERISSTDGHTFEYYKDQLHEQAMFTIPPAVRWLVRLFPESKADIAPIVLGLKPRIYRDLQRANLERERLMNVISLGVNLLFFEPAERVQLTKNLTQQIKQFLSLPDVPFHNFMGILEDCYIAAPEMRSVIRKIVEDNLPAFKRQIVDSVSAYQMASFFRVLEADEVEIASDGRLVLTSKAHMGKTQPLPERNLAA